MRADILHLGRTIIILSPRRQFGFVPGTTRVVLIYLCLTLIDRNNGSTEDWVALTDEATGKVYYVNSRTNESSWDKPASISTPPTKRPSQWTKVGFPFSLFLSSVRLPCPIQEVDEETGDTCVSVSLCVQLEIRALIITLPDIM